MLLPEHDPRSLSRLEADATRVTVLGPARAALARADSRRVAVVLALNFPLSLAADAVRIGRRAPGVDVLTLVLLNNEHPSAVLTLAEYGPLVQEELFAYATSADSELTVTEIRQTH